jgi:hypothetical protein
MTHLTAKSCDQFLASHQQRRTGSVRKCMLTCHPGTIRQKKTYAFSKRTCPHVVVVVLPAAASPASNEQAAGEDLVNLTGEEFSP